MELEALGRIHAKSIWTKSRGSLYERLCSTLVFHVRYSCDVFFTILHLELCGLHWHLPYLSSTHGVFRVDPISSVELRHVLHYVFVNWLSHGALILKNILWCLDLDIVLSSSSRMEAKRVSLILIGGGNLSLSDGCFRVVSLESLFIFVCIFCPPGISVLYPRTGTWLSFLPCLSGVYR